MPKRWLIRTLFMLPLLLCLAAWAVSARHNPQISYSDSGYSNSCGLAWGSVYLARGKLEIALTDGTTGRPEDGWKSEIFPRDFHIVDPHFFKLVNGSFLGFGCNHFSGTVGDATFDVRGAGVPLWFLMVVSSVLLFVAWRKTGEGKAARGFPVEMDS